MSTPGTVYLIHFSAKLAHGQAQHYLGWSALPSHRLKVHQAAQGARITRQAVAEGLHLMIVMEWEGGRDVERHLKRRKNARRLCPWCRPDALQRHAEAERGYRLRRARESRVDT